MYLKGTILDSKRVNEMSRLKIDTNYSFTISLLSIDEYLNFPNKRLQNL